MKDIVLSNVSVTFGNNKLYDNFNCTFSANKVHAIVGRSGCGKTTLLNVIAHLVNFEGSCSTQKVSYVFQGARLAPTTVLNNVKLVLNGTANNERQQLASKFLTMAEIADKSNVNVSTLSGGEQQRVALARAFAYQSEVLLMDEPFKSLDLAVKRKLYATLDNLLTQNNRTVVLVTHDIDEALLLADEIYLLHDRPCVLTKVATLSTNRQQRNLYDNEMAQLRQKLEQSI